MLESVLQSIIAIQIVLCQFLASILQVITQLLILVIVNLNLKILPLFLLEIYLRIFLPYEVEFFSHKDFFADMRHYAKNNKFAMTIISSRPIKIYLVCDWGIKY